jgi:hypothetical protein
MSVDAQRFEGFGEPDLTISSLRVWIHGREFPDATDYWDGNWLRVSANCIHPESAVRVHGPIIHLSEVVGLERGCRRLYDTLQGQACLDCVEPTLHVELNAETRGQIIVQITITPNHLAETHRFTGELDQTHLPPIIASCSRILEKFPVREVEKLPA